MEEQDFRVKLSSKRVVVEQINKYKELLKKTLDGQTGMTEEAKRLLLQELLTNFETAVQDNVLINGQPWEDAPEEEEDESISLDILLDEHIEKTAKNRRRRPQEIVPHVVRSLKAERKIMEMYDHDVKPQDVGKIPDQEGIMSDLSAAVPGMFKQASSVMKSLQALQQHAESLRQVLSATPSPASQQIDQEVFRRVGGANEPSSPLLAPPTGGGATGTVQRAEAEFRGWYAPPTTKPAE